MPVTTRYATVQVEIAWRGLEALRVGGLMAYSTCTYNPIEGTYAYAYAYSHVDVFSYVRSMYECVCVYGCVCVYMRVCVCMHM